MSDSLHNSEDKPKMAGVTAGTKPASELSIDEIDFVLAAGLAITLKDEYGIAECGCAFRVSRDSWQVFMAPCEDHILESPRVVEFSICKDESVLPTAAKTPPWWRENNLPDDILRS